jgi:hypothetical protein
MSVSTTGPVEVSLGVASPEVSTGVTTPPHDTLAGGLPTDEADTITEPPELMSHRMVLVPGPGTAEILASVAEVGIRALPVQPSPTLVSVDTAPSLST